MLIATTDTVAGNRIIATPGLVRGNTVRSRHIGADTAAALRTPVGGELPGYTRLVGAAREQALDRVAAKAEALGASAVVDMPFAISALRNATEILADGTVVRPAVEPAGQP